MPIDRRIAAIKRELEVLADGGATLKELDLVLARKMTSREDREALWLYAWSLVRAQARRMLVGKNGLNQDGEGIRSGP